MRDELLLLIFVHGFKGGADTFGAFPERVGHILRESQPNVDVQPIVYPPFDTRGELAAAVAERKSEFQDKGGQGPTRVILLGHSMGGLVISDTVLSILGTSALPILGVVAFDSPLLGLHPGMFRNTFDKAIGYASQGQAVLAGLGAGYGMFKSAAGGNSSSESAKAATSSSKADSKSSKKDTAVAPPDPDSAAAAQNKSSWFSLKTVGLGAAAIGAMGAAGAAYLHRDVIGSSLSWATSHLSFVGELWKPAELEKRMQRMTAATKQGVGFHCFYTFLPATSQVGARTFCVLPTSSDVSPLWSPNTNTRADTEITAHIEMFTEKSDGLYSLGQETCKLISEWLDEARAGNMGGAEHAQREEDKQV
ncbi:hypothetical protein OIO90_002782 [Microbotryomycetes sp. JL221]|nr:hypothetical protein OIO90_002782 [Microbotryomycetes sp. JL221]